MSPLRIYGATSGYSQISAPDAAGDQSFTLPGVGGTVVVNSAGVTTVTTLQVGTAVTANSNGVQVGAGKSIRIFGSTSGYSDLIASSAAGSGQLLLPDTGGTLDRLERAGNILQVVEANYATAASTTTAIPFDSTIPQNTEGTEILSASITPASSTNKLHISVSLPFVDTSGTGISAALFQDSTANAIAYGVISPAGSGYSSNISFLHYMVAGTTSSTTFKVRYGTVSGGTAYVNRSAGGTTMGGISAARIVIMEVAA